jgi:hypothetical protein
VNPSFPSALAELATALDDAGVRFALCGALATVAYGIPRATFDCDLVVGATIVRLVGLGHTLASGWYTEPACADPAVLVHRGSGIKFDLYPAVEGEFETAQLDRARPMPIHDRTVPVISAEDILLANLRWCANGGAMADYHWNDAVGVIVISGPLDTAYLQHWAARLGVTDLLEKAQADAALD